jgi:nitrous oxidase accessory protein
MRWNKLVGLTALIILLLGNADAATLTVNASGGADYTRIQDAIDNASAGDTILVYSGIYSENVVVNKQLILRGIDNGNGKPVVYAVNLSAGNSILDGFIASGSNGGIVVNSNNNIISNNTVQNYYLGEVGIHVYYSSNNELNGNTVQNNGAGIELEVSSNNTLKNNIASFNGRGIYLTWFSNNNTLSNNTASYNDCGICFEQSSNNTLNGNCELEHNLSWYFSI